jgi:hypothetical protein
VANATEPDAIKQRVQLRSNFMAQGYFGDGDFLPRDQRVIET